MDQATRWANRRGLHTRLHFRAANAAISLPTLLASYPGPVRLVCVQVRKLGHQSAQEVWQVDNNERGLIRIKRITDSWGNNLQIQIQIHLLSSQYPDPHVRRQRHVVHRDFVRGLAGLLPPGGEVGGDGVWPACCFWKMKCSEDRFIMNLLVWDGWCGICTW